MKNRLLINAGADVNANDVRDYTPLHIVAKSANEDIMTLLLENGASPNVVACKKFNKTPLHRARTGRMVQILLQYGASPYERYLPLVVWVQTMIKLNITFYYFEQYSSILGSLALSR